jgi:hypothetical protein
MDEEKVKVTWYCGYFVGAPKWHGTEHYEPDECGTVFETEELRWQWDIGECSTECPFCHGELWQENDHPELSEGKTPSIPQHKEQMLRGRF